MNPSTDKTFERVISGMFFVFKCTRKVQNDSVNNHKSNDPSWLPHVALILKKKGNAEFELFETKTRVKSFDMNA